MTKAASSIRCNGSSSRPVGLVKGGRSSSRRASPIAAISMHLQAAQLSPGSALPSSCLSARALRRVTLGVMGAHTFRGTVIKAGHVIPNGGSDISRREGVGVGSLVLPPLGVAERAIGTDVDGLTVKPAHAEITAHGAGQRT